MCGSARKVAEWTADGGLEPERLENRYSCRWGKGGWNSGSGRREQSSLRVSEEEDRHLGDLGPSVQKREKGRRRIALPRFSERAERADTPHPTPTPATPDHWGWSWNRPQETSDEAVPKRSLVSLLRQIPGA